MQTAEIRRRFLEHFAQRDKEARRARRAARRAA